MATEKREYLTGPEAAERAGVSGTTIYTWCYEYGIGIKVGGRWRIDPKELGKVLDGSLWRELKEAQK